MRSRGPRALRLIRFRLVRGQLCHHLGHTTCVQPPSRPKSWGFPHHVQYLIRKCKWRLSCAVFSRILKTELVDDGFFSYTHPPTMPRRWVRIWKRIQNYSFISMQVWPNYVNIPSYARGMQYRGISWFEVENMCSVNRVKTRSQHRVTLFFAV
jgi:hypothetical protein